MLSGEGKKNLKKPNKCEKPINTYKLTHKIGSGSLRFKYAKRKKSTDKQMFITFFFIFLKPKIFIIKINIQHFQIKFLCFFLDRLIDLAQ